MTFIKATYNQECLEAKLQEVKTYFTNNLNSGYKLNSVNGSLANGISVYASVIRLQTNEEITFRVSNHENGFGANDISVTSFGIQVQGMNIDAMLVYFGEKKKANVDLEMAEQALVILRKRGYDEDSSNIRDVKKRIVKYTVI